MGNDRNKGIVVGAFALLAAVIIVVVLLTGNNDNDAPIVAQAPPAAETPDAETPEAPPVVEGSDDLEDTDAKPNVPAAEGDAPDELVTEDIVKGEGKSAKDGDNLTMDYVGVLYDDGSQFDASWDNGQPFEFTLGGGQVIRGWDEGIVGMKVGGRRLLTIPPDMGYGEAGSPPTIPENATLMFMVDLRAIN